VLVKLAANADVAVITWRITVITWRITVITWRITVITWRITVITWRVTVSLLSLMWCAVFCAQVEVAHARKLLHNMLPKHVIPRCVAVLCEGNERERWFV
jgi:hypothetical protein